MNQIEAIKAEIERRYADYHSKWEETRDPYLDGKADALDLLLSFIESLEQKSQCDGCVNDKGCVTCVDGNMKETVESLEKEQPQGLDEAAEEYAQEEMMGGLAERAFKAGAKWMAGQGETKVLTVESPVLGPPMICCPVNASNGDRVMVQIRKI